MESISQEARTLVQAIADQLPRTISGRDAVTQMRREGSRQWRQMEWIGFWLEHVFSTRIKTSLGGKEGPRYGRTVFDIQRNYVWDLKAHPVGTKDLILNDREAIDRCVEDYGGIGFLIVHGQAQYDESGDFHRWHEVAKEKKSSYQIEGERIGRKSRRRKTGFSPIRVDAVWVPSLGELREGQGVGWLGSFQKGMVNSNGMPRREKYRLVTEKLPPQHILASAHIR